MHRVYILFFIFLSASIWGEVSQPFTQIPTESDRVNLAKKLHAYSEDTIDDADKRFEYAKLQILANNYTKARKYLQLALQLEPNFQNAQIQLAYLDLWEDRVESAYRIFMKVQRESPCNRLTWEGLEEIAHKWEKIGKKKEALKIYTRLIECAPDNCDYYFYKGRLLKSIGERKEGDLFLAKAAELCPEYKESIVSKTDKTAIPPPITELPNEFNGEKLKEFNLQHKNIKTDAILRYKRARFEILAGVLDLAEEDLKLTLQLNPEFQQAYLQLAYIDLWNGNLERAHTKFVKINIEKPCHKMTWDGLEKIAEEYRNNPNKQEEALAIYEGLLSCKPDNCDWLFFKSLLLRRLGFLEESVSTLSEVLERCPDYADAAFVLANIYVSRKWYAQAEAIYLQFYDDLQAKLGLGNIALLKGCYCNAAGYFEEVLEESPCHEQARRAVAYIYERLRLYNLSKCYYQNLICEDRCDQDLINYYYYYVKPFTNPSFTPEWTYTYSKEEDPSLDHYVVNTLYIGTNLNVTVPVSDCLLFDGKVIYFHQKEKDILPPKGTNYSGYYSGAQISSHYYFKPNWRWDMTLRGLYAWGSDDALFPFDERSSFEPGTGFVYDDRRRYFSIGSYFESFITKNFDDQEAQLFRILANEARVGIRFIEFPYTPQAWAWTTISNYRGERYNWRYGQTLFVQSGLPQCPDLRFSYLLEFSHFEKLSRNYFSYDKQWLHILGVEYFKEFGRTYMKLNYHQRFRKTRDLFLPVGDTVFVADRLAITAYNPSFTLGYRCGEKANIELYTHYYYDTFRYWDWNFSGYVNVYF